MNSFFFMLGEPVGVSPDHDHPILQLEIRGILFTAETCTYGNQHWHPNCPQFEPDQDNRVLDRTSCWKLFKLTTTAKIRCNNTNLRCLSTVDIFMNVFNHQWRPANPWDLEVSQWSFFYVAGEQHIVISANYWIHHFNEVICCPYNGNKQIPINLEQMYHTFTQDITPFLIGKVNNVATIKRAQTELRRFVVTLHRLAQ